MELGLLNAAGEILVSWFAAAGNSFRVKFNPVLFEANIIYLPSMEQYSYILQRKDRQIPALCVSQTNCSMKQFLWWVTSEYVRLVSLL